MTRTIKEKQTVFLDFVFINLALYSDTYLKV
jgi:hypothetical protein